MKWFYPILLLSLASTSVSFGDIIEKDGGTSKSKVDHPDLDIAYNDSFKDYYREGKLVLRRRDRNAVYTFKHNGEKLSEERSVTLMVPIEEKVILTFGIDSKGNPIELNSSSGVYFATGLSLRDPKKAEMVRWFHICIPDKDYYEYVEVIGTEFSFPAEQTYTKTKESFMKSAKQGYVVELQKGQSTEK